MTNLESTNKNVIENKVAGDFTYTEISRSIRMFVHPAGAKVNIVDVLLIACQAIDARDEHIGQNRVENNYTF